MNNPIGKIGMVTVFEDWDRIQEFIDACENPGEAALAAMFVWNYAHGVVEKELEKADDSA